MSSVSSHFSEIFLKIDPIFVLRHPNAGNRRLEIITQAVNLCCSTVYSRHIGQEAAPTMTDCVTAACYVALKAFEANFCPEEYEVTTISKLPVSMMLCGWRVEPITALADLQPGDMLFLMRSAGKINHMAVCLGSFMAFHSNKEDGTGVFESYQTIFKKYKPIQNPVQLAAGDFFEPLETGSAVSSEKTVIRSLSQSFSPGSFSLDPERLSSTVRISLDSISLSDLQYDRGQVERRAIRVALMLRRRSASTPPRDESPSTSSLGDGDVWSPEMAKPENVSPQRANASSVAARTVSFCPGTYRRFIENLRLDDQEEIKAPEESYKIYQK